MVFDPFGNSKRKKAIPSKQYYIIFKLFVIAISNSLALYLMYFINRAFKINSALFYVLKNINLILIATCGIIILIHSFHR